MVRKTIWYRPLTLMICLNQLATQDYIVKSVSLRSKIFCIMKIFQNMLKTWLRCWKAIIIWQNTFKVSRTWPKFYLWILIVFEIKIGIFFSSLRLMMPWMIVYDKIQAMVTSVLDGNVFLVVRALSIIDWKCIFLCTSWS